MKHLAIILICATLAFFSACGGSSNTIQSVQVNPPQGQGTAPGGAVGFIANGTFQQGQSRLLTSEDGLSWSSSNTTVATINSLTGQAICQSGGVTTITGAVPSDLQFGPSGHTSSNTVKGTASLTCLPAG